VLIAIAGLLVGMAVAASGASGERGSTQARWVITDLGPGVAVDINERGQVVGGGAWIWQKGEKAQLGTLGGPSSSVRAINNAGQVIGGSLTRKPAKGHSFLWQNGKMIDLAPLGAIAINDRGQVVGAASTASGNSHAFLWENGKLRDLGSLGGPTSGAVAINNHGQIVGSADTKMKDRNGTSISHAFLWEKGKMRDLGTLGRGYTNCGAADINERGQVVGSCFNPTSRQGRQPSGTEHAFLWQDGSMRDLGTLGGNPPWSSAVAINDRGWVIGNSPPIWNWRAFLWRNGTITDLGTLGAGGHHSEAVAINNRGQVIGDSVPPGPHGMSHAFVWQNGHMTDLGTLGGYVSVPTAINERNQVVGSSNTAGGKGHAVLWTLNPGS
jgi:probable HAF family extracellular repeat protein